MYKRQALKSLAYHGFKKIIMINGHGSNQNPLEIAGRRAMLESDAWVAMAGWWFLSDANSGFQDTWRDSPFPGGAAHAGEAETSLAMHLDPDAVKMDLAVDQVIDHNKQESKYHWVDLFAAGPIRMDGWTSTYTPDGTMGNPTMATADKGQALFEETVKYLIEFAEEFAAREFLPRTDHHGSPPTMDPPG